MARFRVRPSRFSSIITVVVGIGMLIFLVSEFSDRKGPTIPWGKGDSGSGGFIAIFVIALVCIIGYHLFNAFTDKGAAHEVIDFEEDGEVFSPKPRGSNRGSFRNNRGDDERKDGADSVADRLRKLKSLKDQELISPEEYDRKRREIIDEV